MPPQVHNQGQSLVMPLSSNQGQTRQQLLSQNVQNSAAVQSSSSVSSTLLPPTSLSQNMPGNSQNTVGYANTHRQMQVRQQVPQQQQQSQNQQQYLYQQQLVKPKFPQGNVPQSILQSHIQQQQQQQQNVLQSTQLQSSQQAVVQTSSAMQPPLIQSSVPSMQQNQSSSIQQSSKAMLQTHPQSVLRPQSHSQQAAVAHQQQTQVSQQQQQQQQQLISQQKNTTNMQQSHLIGQQNNVGDLQQQQRLLSQQNNLSNLQQQQQQLMAPQSNISNLHQQQLGPQSNGLQQQLHGTQTGNSSMQTNQHSVHMRQQQSKVPMQQQLQQSGSNLLPSQAQQPQQQIVSQIQSQPQMQQQLGLQQQPNPLQREMRLQPSGQNVIDQQKQLYQPQRPLLETSSTSVDSAATGHASGVDWQEEVYQKIKSMKELYLPELHELYQKIAGKLQQLDSLPQQPKSEQLDKLKLFKSTLERTIQFLQVPKVNIIPGYKEKLVHTEKQIISFINTNRPRKPVSQLQQGHASSHMHSMQQPQSQINQVQSHENQMNPQLQSKNVQSSVGPMQQNSMTSFQQNSMPALSAVSTTQQNVMNTLQSSSNVDSGQGNALNSLQQTSVTALQQANINALSSQNGINNLQSNSNMVQHQHMKQQQEQQMKQQYQQRQMQQQILQQQKQQILQQQQQKQQQQQHQQQQQQQLQQQAKQQLPAQLQTPQNQMLHHQINDVNDLKARQSMAVKSGVFQQHLPAGQRAAYTHQQLKSSSPFAISSNQLLQASSPLQHSSPQVDQQNLLPSLTKAGTPLQSASSPFVVPSPSTPLAPSPMPGDSDKPLLGVSSLANAGNVGQQTSVVAPSQSLAIGTPGISASPLLAEFIGPDGTQGNTSISVFGKSSITEQPLDRLMKAVKSMSPKALSASVRDIGSVVSMVDRFAGSAPGNGSRAAVGEDLVAMTNCRLQVRNFMSHDGTNGTRKMKRYTSAMPLNVVSSTSSINDSEISELESTATSGIKRCKLEAIHALKDEIREINQRLIDTVIDISEESSVVAAAAEGGEGTIVKCSFSAVALSPNMKLQYASAQMSPIQPLRLLVPTNYPNCSPILLDVFPVEVSKEYEDLSVKAKSRFSISLRTLSQPMSLGAMVRTWDVCARAVISEHAQKSGGGSFSSKYGTWETGLSAT
ncbi:mediator of RNA polymerase II transcription subunit 15a-like isoform X2 [Humulus lupulus]|nr:mediator of RNA polymerase II transcription subunit 15a-like isoform X2 [Humulus lupulus]